MMRCWSSIAVAISCCLFAVAACERSPQPKPVEVTETVETAQLSMEALIDRMVAQGKRSVEEEQQKGHKNTVGLADGTWWLETSDLVRIIYVRSLADLADALAGIDLAVSSEAYERETTKGLKSIYGVGQTYQAGYEAESYLSGRIGSVVAGHSFADIAQAVTNFYRNKPLLKDKPVIWVLAVPLYKESQEARSKEQRSSVYDSVSLDMRREGKQ